MGMSFLPFHVIESRILVSCEPGHCFLLFSWPFTDLVLRIWALPTILIHINFRRMLLGTFFYSYWPFHYSLFLWLIEFFCLLNLFFPYCFIGILYIFCNESFVVYIRWEYLSPGYAWSVFSLYYSILTLLLKGEKSQPHFFFLAGCGGSIKSILACSYMF